MRRDDPEGIPEAHRAGLLARLTQGTDLNALEAEDWVNRWELHAEAEGLSRETVGFWDAAWDWIAGERAPKRDMGAEADDGQVYGG